MKKFITFDCETDPFKHGRVPKPFLWVAHGEEGPLGTWHNTAEFVAWLKQQEVIAYAHNGGKFDFHFLLDYLDVGQPLMLINGRIAKATLGRAELRDSWLVLPTGLAAYQKDEIDYAKFEPECRAAHMGEIVQYAQGDVRYLFEVLALNFKLYGQKLTLASAAFDYWKTNFFKGKAPKTTAGYFEEYKPFYYGGHVECFEKGLIEGEFGMYDINSAYPYAMQFLHPWGDEVEAGAGVKIKPWSFVELTCVSKGAFPFRAKDGLTFPADDKPRLYKITGHEYLTAKRLGLIKKVEVHNVITHKATIHFTDYVKHFYGLKKATDKKKQPGEYLLVKLYLNSLYGKFGQSSLDHKEYVIIERCHLDFYCTDLAYSFVGECGQNNAIVGSPITADKMRFFNVATAASITGFVRAYLLEAIHKSKGIIYCDTDSLACREFGGTLGTELGQWSHEGDFSKGAIAGKKMYAFLEKEKVKYKISAKGVKISAKEIFDVAKGKKVLYKNIAPTFSVNKKPQFLEREVKQT